MIKQMIPQPLPGNTFSNLTYHRFTDDIIVATDVHTISSMDLQKAFDSVEFEFPVFFKRLFDTGIISKAWHILRSWYSDCRNSVCVGHHVSPPLLLCDRGLSCLQPCFYWLWTPKPFWDSSSSHSSLVLQSTTCFMHAAYLYTIAASASTLEAQIPTITKFTEENFLKLYATKCEIIISKKSDDPLLYGREESWGWWKQLSCAVKQHALDISGGRTCPPHQWSKIASRGPGRLSFSLAVPLPSRVSWVPYFLLH